jgi:hypothetical protein
MGTKGKTSATVSARERGCGWEIKEEGVGFGWVREVVLEVDVASAVPAARALATVWRGADGGGGAMLGAENLDV